MLIILSRKHLVVPEARAALEQFKVEMSKELDINGSSSANNDYLASFHTGRITKKLIEMGEKQLIDK